jgi:hypothetical protein
MEVRVMHTRGLKEIERIGLQATYSRNLGIHLHGYRSAKLPCPHSLSESSYDVFSSNKFPFI